MSAGITRRAYRGVAAFGAFAVLAIAGGIAIAVAHHLGIGITVATAGVVTAGLGFRLDVRRRRSELALWDARAQARGLRRQLEQLRADAGEHPDPDATPVTTETVAPEGAAGASSTEDWEIDPVSGLLREQHLPVLVQQVVAAARRKVLPVSVVFWELDALDTASARAHDQAITALGAVAWRILRESDTVFRLGDVAAVAVLVDTAEAGALLAADRVREGLRSSPVGDALTVSAGIAGYPTHALDAAELVMRAGQALEAARASGYQRDHVAVATID